ncbi:TonB-dependent receptor [Candidatus Omnitrophota bacterium]
MNKICFILLLVCCLVNGQGAEAEQVQLAPVVITPWRVEELAANVSKNVTLIESEEIQKSDASYAYEIIEEKVGVVVSGQFDNPKGTVVDIRGFGESSPSNLLVLVNGRRTNQIDLSGVDWGQINKDAIERIEIVRGPGTVLYGDNARGGVINIITKKGLSAEPVFSLGVQKGSDDHYKEFFNFGAAGDAYDYFLNYAHQQSDGYRANNDYFANDCFGRANLRAGENLAVEFSAGYHHDHYGMPGALYLNGNRFALNPRGINQIGRTGSVFPEDRGWTEEFYTTVQPQFSLDIHSHNLSASIFTSFRSRRSKGLNIPEANAWAGRSEYETVHHIKSYDFKPKFEFEAYLFNAQLMNRITFGYDYFYALDQILSGDRLAQQDSAEIIKQTHGVYFHDNIRLRENMLLNLGARAEWADYVFDQKRVLVNYETKQTMQSAAEVGLGYKYNDGSQVYFNFTKAYRNPNTEEYYQNRYFDTWNGVERGGLNQNLKHQRSNNFEIGIKDTSFRWLKVNANYYWMATRSEIYFDPATFNNSNYSPKTMRKGVELELSSSFFDATLRPYLNYLFQEAYFKGGRYANERIPFVPKHKVSAGVLVPFLDSYEWSLGLTYVASRYKVSDQNNIAPRLKGYLTFDSQLSYSKDNLRAYLAIKNMFNEKYYSYGVTNSTGTAETFYPAPERQFQAGLELSF